MNGNFYRYATGQPRTLYHVEVLLKRAKTYREC